MVSADSSAGSGKATVGVVIATHNRPELVRAALRSVLEQRYDGDIEVALVFDRTEPDHSLEQDEHTEHGRRVVRVLANTRTPGLAGSRNSGILTLTTDYVAFCDDDDEWLPGKLAAQVARLERDPRAVMCTTAMRVSWEGRETDRLAGCDEVGVQHLARSRMAMLHSSSFVFRRDAFERLGLVDERIPKSMAEDWDILLRAARLAPVAHIDQPYVLVRWGASSSYFMDAWHDRNVAHQWLIDEHPEFEADAVGAAFMHAKLAFGHAAVGHRRVGLRHAAAALRRNWREPRTPLALAVVLGVPARRITEALNKRGRGI